MTTPALTTLEQALDEIGRADDVARHKARLERYIAAASAQIEAFCDRPFSRVAGVVEKTRRYGSTLLHVRRIPIVSVTSISINGSTVDSDDYEIVPEGHAIYKGSGWGDSARTAGGPTFTRLGGSEKPDATVTYDGGYITRAQNEETGGDFEGAGVTLPEDLEHACLRLVAHMWHQRDRMTGLISKSTTGGSVSFAQHQMPPEVLGILSRYRAIVHA